MVNTFPQLSNISDYTREVILDRAGNNSKVSKLIPWMRVMSAVGRGLVIESIPANDSVSQRYGNSQRGGRIGIDFKGESYYEDVSVRGYRPSPTISAISIQNGAQGLSRKTTFTITCYTLGQLEVINKHFLEPGYTILVEYGWNTQKSYDQKYGFDTCEIAKHNNVKTILEKRENSGGTYDAVLGFITGGGIEYGDGETFSVNVELTSLGEIPAYLQPHKGFTKAASVAGRTNPDTGKKFYPQQISAARGIGGGGKSNRKVGKALFMQMYNDLPDVKQIEEVKKLVDNERWTDPANYINMDEKIRENLRKDFTEGEVRNKKAGKKNVAEAIPEGIQLLSSERFIRLDLAFEILNTVQEGTLIPVVDGICGKTSLMNNKVSIDDTICRAHKHIFSTDPSKLFIPNRNLPDFGLNNVFNLTGSQKDVTSFVEFVGEGKNRRLSRTVDGHPDTDRQKKYFPRPVKIDYVDMRNVIPDAMPEVHLPYTWGWLTDLYINFDFFREVIDKKGLVIKDVVYELLNGISSAVNMYWEFQIVDRCSKGQTENKDEARFNAEEGVQELQVREIGTGGVPTEAIKTTFQSRGVKTPFLNSSLNMDIPGAMKNMIVGQRNSAASGNAEARDILLEKDGLFSNQIDPVLDAISSWKKSADSQKTQQDPPTDEEIAKQKKEEKKENRKKAFELFTRTSAVFPKIQDFFGNTDAVYNFFDFIKDSNEASIDELLIVGAFNDPSLLAMIQKMDTGSYTGGEYKGITQNSIVLPIKFNFTIHGVSGLKVGDVFKISDLPKKYASKIFQIMRINHSMNEQGWFTEVEAQIRNTDKL